MPVLDAAIENVCGVGCGFQLLSTAGQAVPSVCSSELSRMLSRAHMFLPSSSIRSHGSQVGIVGLLS